jgi:hypothetical protein
MRKLLATVVILGGLLTLNSTTEASECDRAQNEDPAGRFAGYSCWAREAFARGSGGAGGGD